MLFGRHRLKSLVSASHNYAIAGLLLLGVALAGVRGRHLRHRPGPVAAWIADECTLLALAGFWFLLPLRERGSQDTAQPGL